MSEIEWLRAHEGEPVGPVTVDVPEARALVVGVDEVLVVVFPSWVPMDVLAAHRTHLTEVLQNRFFLVTGNDIQLAKVRAQDWASSALELKARGQR